MVAYKDEERGTWYVSFYYEDWTGAKKRKELQVIIMWILPFVM